MRTSKMLLATIKENPGDTQTISHQLMLRAGMIRQLGSGLYHWLPMGLRVLRKVERIVREELAAINCEELLMPMVHPEDIWKETGRWDSFNPKLAVFKDRTNREYCLAPTHEEAITSIIRHELKSYKQCPLYLFQIQTKFRDEARPRAGILRAREFIMKDAYSFDMSKAAMAQSYEKFYSAYVKIFTRLGLTFRAALADTGSIGGDKSHEFQVIAASGEDKIAISDESDYAANIEQAEALALGQRDTKLNPMECVDTPNTPTIEAVAAFLKQSPEQSLKAIMVNGVEENSIVALFLRGDHRLNELKAEKHPLVASPLTFADPKLIEKVIGCPQGFLGPMNLTIPVIVDRSAATLSNFTCGANQQDKHYINVNWGRDCNEPEVADLREVNEGDPSPDGKGTLTFARGIEVGHIFQLGEKYSQDMNATILDENGKSISLQMGCYGLGVSRVVGAAIEQNHDEHGIVWPDSIAPFHIALVPINMHKSKRLQLAAEALYQKLTEAGYEVLFDDRKDRPGVMFADMELIGIPHRLVISERGLDEHTIEYRHRRASDNELIKMDELMSFLGQTIANK